MTDNLKTGTAAPGLTETAALPLGTWVRANALGLAVALGLFALVGGGIEAMGADHDSVARNLPAILAMLAGGTLFALLRRRVSGTIRSSQWQLLIIGACVPAGFLLGMVAPFDWVVAMLVAGTIGGALQLRPLRPVNARSLLVSAGSWWAAGVAATVTVVALIDGVLVGMLGIDPAAIDAAHGATSVILFTVAFSLLGLVGGAVGGAVEGAVLRRRLRLTYLRNHRRTGV